MDRTMYGRIDPGARQPYRCTVKQHGISPAYALLADLQNSVPVNTNSLPHTTHHVNTHHSSPGYGSLNTGRPKQSPQSPTYQTQTRIVTEKRTSPVYNNPSSVFNGSNQLGYQSTPHNSLPRSGTPQHQTGNLSELDTLLQDLSSARYGSNLDKKDGTLSPIGNDSLKRPSVDSLLDELSSAHNVAPIYALPNGNNGAESVVPGTPGTPGGRHVTITVRETTTEKISGQPGSPPLQNNQIQQTNHQQISQQQTSQQQTSHQQTNHQQTHQAITQTRQNMVANSPAPTVYAASASSATKELDDLMASLSDFKNRYLIFGLRYRLFKAM